MPVYHIVLHAYGSWHADHPDGWHQHGVGRPLRPNKKLANHRRAIQKNPTAEFPGDRFVALAEMSRDICKRRKWRCHAVAITPTHIHIVASWPLANNPTVAPQTVFKRLLAWKLAQLTVSSKRPWFSAGGLPKPVENLEHLHYLKTDYLPKQGGHFWKEY